MGDSTPTQLRFPAIAGFTVRADFEGGAVSSDSGAPLLHGVDRQTGLIARLASAIKDRLHPSYIEHSLTDLLHQRIFQSACGYADGNDANSLRHDPAFRRLEKQGPHSPPGWVHEVYEISRLGSPLNCPVGLGLSNCPVFRPAAATR